MQRYLEQNVCSKRLYNICSVFAGVDCGVAAAVCNNDFGSIFEQVCRKFSRQIFMTLSLVVVSTCNLDNLFVCSFVWQIFYVILAEVMARLAEKSVASVTRGLQFESSRRQIFKEHLVLSSALKRQK